MTEDKKLLIYSMIIQEIDLKQYQSNKKPKEQELKY